MVHVRIWKFQPQHGREEQFAEAYGCDGTWALLFRQGQGFIGTELLTPLEVGGWWLTIDRWRSLGDFEAFQSSHGEEYANLDAGLESISGKEEFVGAFETAV